jgi:hypothetical protein
MMAFARRPAQIRYANGSLQRRVKPLEATVIPNRRKAPVRNLLLAVRLIAAAAMMIGKGATSSRAAETPKTSRALAPEEIRSYKMPDNYRCDEMPPELELA